LATRAASIKTSASQLEAKARTFAAHVGAHLNAGRRAGMADTCNQIKKFSSDQLKTAMKTAFKDPNAPAKCGDAYLKMFNTMCTPDCQKSPMMKSVFSPSPPKMRRLLGGVDTSKPSTMCKDPCFVPIMSATLAMIPVMNDPKCAQSSGGRRLLGGSTMSAADAKKTEDMLGLMCSKNEAGKYCMDVFETMGKINTTDDRTSEQWTTCKTECSSCSSSSIKACDSACANVQSTVCSDCAKQKGCSTCLTCFKTKAKDKCSMPASLKKPYADLGCCWGTAFAMASAADLSTSSSKTPAPAPAPQMDITKFNAEFSKCGITLSAAPCKPKGVDIKSVETDTKLSGVTIAQFDTKAQTAFKKGLAKTAGTKSSQVVITSYKATSRRSAGLDVKTQITLMGSDTSKASSLKTKLSDKAALQKNLKEADSTSALASATVTSSSSKDGFSVKGEGVSSSSSRSKGISAAVLISAAVAAASSIFSA
jgi:hypothetical protein